MKAEMNDTTNVLAVQSSKDEQGRAVKLMKDSRHSVVKPQDQAPADERDQGTFSTVRTAELRDLRFFWRPQQRAHSAGQGNRQQERTR